MNKTQNENYRNESQRATERVMLQVSVFTLFPVAFVPSALSHGVFIQMTSRCFLSTFYFDSKHLNGDNSLNGELGFVM